jgi:amidohydrolase
MSASAGLSAIDSARQSLTDMSRLLAAEPEEAWSEHKSAERLATLCESLGFTVQRQFKGIATSFEAKFSNGDGPTVVICSEYDALPGIGGAVRHACGHNLIAVSAVATGVAMKAALQSGAIQGQVIVLGTPAEETTGGKINLINAGVFDKVDFSMMVHPSNETVAFTRALAMTEVKATFLGRNAHAAGEPWQGLNALDAAVAAYTNISLLRQQMTPESRVHGIFTEGGSRPNIVPDRAQLHYYIRSPDRAELVGLKKRVSKCFEAAALATGCQVELEWIGEPFLDVQSNNVLAERWSTHFASLTGEKVPGKNDPVGGLGSTDMGNVSQVVAAIHPCFKICDDHGCHTAGFADAAVTTRGEEQALAAAKAMFLTAFDVFSDKALLEKVKSEFAATKQRLDAKAASFV